MATIGYIKGQGIYFPTELKTIPKKADSPLQPIFEAFTNAWESIRTFHKRNKTSDNGRIEIDFIFKENLHSKETKEFDIERISITDTGIGFEDSEFERFINLRDNRKNFSNKGTGRVQFLHSFNTTKYDSVYRDENSSTGFKRRQITLSSSEAFLIQNAIARLDSEEEVKAETTSTTITFELPLNSSDIKFYSYINAKEIRKDLIRHYLAGFCEHRKNLPVITIRKIVKDKIIEQLNLTNEDIPVPDKEEPLKIKYSRLENNQIAKTEKTEDFNLKAFLIPENELEKNELKLISKGEFAKNIHLENLLPTDSINNQRYLFLLSGKYIDERDTDVRGEINIQKRKDFKKLHKDSLFSEEQILIEDIEEETNNKIVTLYNEVKSKNEERTKSIEDLRKMFLLNPETIQTLRNKIHIGDTDDVILKKIYEAEAKIVAKQDAVIKQQLIDLKSLTPTDKDYQEKLRNQVSNVVKAIPIQNRTSLTQYVARRKLVLEMFDKVLSKEIDKLKSGGRIDEDLLHNLIFQQHSDQPEDSDLWLINEEFIYFKGTSESQLEKVKFDGVEIFKSEFTEEVEEYLNSLGEKRLTKRPDVLLFPAEGKCIIIEFKAPDVNVADHLSQIDFYANLIRNYTKDEIQITTFYGYLIGESIQDRDVRGRVSRFEHSYHLDYWFRPSEPVQGFDDRSNGNIYTEVIKYTTLLNRARLRNQIFIDKLEGRK